MAMRLDEVVSGIKADVAVKIFGEDPPCSSSWREQALRVLSAVPAPPTRRPRSSPALPELRVEVDRAALARYGLNVTDVQDVVDRPPAASAYPRWSKGSGGSRSRCGCPSATATISMRWANLLLRVARRRAGAPEPGCAAYVERGPEVISRENGQRRIIVQANVRGRDLGSFVAEAQAEDRRRAPTAARLRHRHGAASSKTRSAPPAACMMVLPLSILIIFGLLFADVPLRVAGAA